MEVVRSCFRSRWRLFRGRPETTDGVYVFAGEDAECYPGFHNLWSRDWISDELEGAELGEDPTATRSYSLGAPLGWVPAPQLIGSADCVANGERWPLAVVPVLDSGFDARCPEQISAPRVHLDVQDRGNWCFWASVVAQTYTDPRSALARVAAAYGLPVAGYPQQNPLGNVPQHFAFIPPPPNPVVIVIAGTTTTGQLLEQIQWGAEPPQQFGNFSTNTFWYRVTDYILGRLLPFAIPTTQEIILVGHSMGAAVATVLAARFSLAHPLRRQQLFTVGSPRAGDQALYSLLSTIAKVNIQADGDIVVGIPLNRSELSVALLALVGGRYPIGSTQWANPSARYRVAWDGAVEQGAADPGLAAAFVQIADWHFLGAPAPNFSVHLPTEYERRLCAPAPVPVVWLDSFDLNQLTGEPVTVWPNKNDTGNYAQQAGPPVNPEMSMNVQRWARAVQFDHQAALQLLSPVGQTPSWSVYAVQQIVWPATGFNLSKRLGSPFSHFAGFLATGAEFQGPGLTGAGWTVTVGGVVATVPWSAGDDVPTLIAVYWDKGSLRIYLESVGDVSATASGIPGDASWQFVGGLRGSLQPFPQASLLLGELLYYDQPLSSTDDASVLDYLRIKWLNRGQVITTESGDWITTESGDVIITE